MYRSSLHENALQRRCELLQEAARARLAAKSRNSRKARINARKRVARALLAFGYFLLDAGHSLDTDMWRPV